MFGELPPQVLYHTRHAQHVVARRSDESQSPTHSLSDRSVSLSMSSSPTNRNMNQSAYIHKSKPRKAVRHGSLPSPTSSTYNLLHDRGSNEASSTHDRRSSVGRRSSSIYMHYRHSLNSLNDIIDRVRTCGFSSSIHERWTTDNRFAG